MTGGTVGPGDFSGRSRSRSLRHVARVPRGLSRHTRCPDDAWHTPSRPDLRRWPYPPALPPTLQNALDRPPLERRGWLRSIAPNYIGLFCWVVYFDQLGQRTLSSGGLGWSVLGAMTAGLLCYQFLYYVPAMWGMRTGRPLTIVATSTFGTTGSVWIAGVAIGLAQVVWFAAGTYYATDLTFEGLVSCRLLDTKARNPVALGGLDAGEPVVPGHLARLELRHGACWPLSCPGHRGVDERDGGFPGADACPGHADDVRRRR